MRRKKDDKRVLVSPRDTRRSPPRRQRRRNNNAPKTKASGKMLLVIIVALAAFVIGAGIGISLSFDDGQDDGPHFENVTKEMTTNLNDTEPIVFDEEADDIDFNDNETLTELNVTEEPSY